MILTKIYWEIHGLQVQIISLLTVFVNYFKLKAVKSKIQDQFQQLIIL